ncbi:Crp/Fnr family transcriptional regulator [Mucilaginibacter robiniae]|uniref:Crp/Fnr family transcriptional regulator n=1 Tax=Mucilaginibacter robiniae TaxID=2728022 RepID=A0A7L5DWQ9_9SPHI|nr:Crp/Fnr family transcriptional regulator [Mucilaginibacter robiniae]QJD94688.1 Crp/Fnr family transcriptional regulator [Mucilaginibacter robiniae]
MDAAHQLIMANVGKHLSLTPDETACFSQMLVQKKFKRKHFLLQQGETCRYSAFVTGGCLRGYTLDRNGFEHVLSFAPSDWWMADMYSLLTQQPGSLNIEALEDTEVWLLSKYDQEQLYLQVPKFERFFRILTEKSLIAYQQRLIDNLSLTASERYARFCQRYPTLIHHLPQKQIAAYIGVTPEFFSKMKKEFG